MLAVSLQQGCDSGEKTVKTDASGSEKAAATETEPKLPAETPCADPPREEIKELAALLEKGDDTAAAKVLGPLREKYPRSVWVEVRSAGAELHSQPAQTERARKFYQAALALHEDGCALSEKDRWSVELGIGLSHMFDGNFDKAVPPLAEASKHFPRSSTLHYNLACSYCKTGDLDACYAELRATLASAASPDKPVGEAKNKSPAHYVSLSKGDGDLENLRAEPRFAQLLAEYE